MAKVTFTVDDKLFRKQMLKIERYVDRTMPREALKEYKKNTPKAKKNGGNARSKTKRRGRTIIGDYGYAGVLDDGLFPNPPREGTGKTIGGYSTQAKKGMATPTIIALQELLNKYVKKVK
jgi:hypothetical protein